MNNNINFYRKLWIDFFQNKSHSFLESSSLIPINDESILWINSGVATLKNYFSGKENPPNKRLVKIQKSIRTNDIENIGKTARHHTFFEMFGNFSIGDYFKDEALKMAFEFLTSKEYLNFSLDNLYFTFYKEDLATKQILIDELKIPQSHIFEMDKDTNFWDMGIGPSGPSCEIFYDRGKKYNSKSAHELISNDIENDRFIELWNIVFSQFNNDGKNNYEELPQKNIDTGLGFERLLSIIEKTPTNFETSLFKPLILFLQNITNYKYEFDYVLELQKINNNKQFLINSHYKIIVDFARAITFALSDGAFPSSTGRGYVIRRLIRRAIISGKQLEIQELFLWKMVKPIVEIMSDFYPDLLKNQDKVENIIKKEEETFNNLIVNGEETIKILINKTNNKITDEDIFMLFETYGLPKFYIEILLDKYNIPFNSENFDKLLEEFRLLSQKNQQKVDAMQKQIEIFEKNYELNQFVGYEFLSNKSAKVLAVQGDYVIFDKTPFYATSGGQINDIGYANSFFVSDVFKDKYDNFIHIIEDNDFFVNQKVFLKIDVIRRQQITSNHSSVHIIFAIMEDYFKVDLPQIGSYVGPEYFRFDFSYHGQVTKDDLNKIQDIANKLLEKEYETKIFSEHLKNVHKLGIKMLSDTNYKEIVRVVQLGDNIIDLCGGTHVFYRKDIEEIFLYDLEKRGSGVFRICGVSGNDKVKSKIFEINKKIYDEYMKNFNKKIIDLNKMLLDTNEEIIDKNHFLRELNNLTLWEKDYQKKSLPIVESLKKSLENIEVSIFGYHWSKIIKTIEEEYQENKIIEIKLISNSLKNIQKKLLKYLNQKKEFYNLIVKIIIVFDNKETVILMLSNEFKNTELLNKEIHFLKTNGLKGSGRNKLYVFGKSL